MADLTPKVIESRDTTVYERGTGKLREITRVWFMLGEQGPFKAEFDPGTFSDSALRDKFDERRRALEAHVG